MKSPGYYLIKGITWPLQIFPLEFYYLLSDFVFFIIFYVVGYRKSVVATNLKNSFPDKSEQERKIISKKFYKGFADTFIETVYLAHLSERRHWKRLTCINAEIVDELYEQGKSVIFVSGHFGNWEFSKLFTARAKHKLYFIYKQLNNKIADQFFNDIRSSSGAHPLEMKQTFRQLVTDSKKGIPWMAVFLGDQRPLRSSNSHWMEFLNQDTAVMLGTEKIARATNAAVIWAEMQKIKRGYWALKFELITDNPKETKEFEITEAHMRKLEKAIRERPEHWLWTHKRWKHKRK